MTTARPARKTGSPGRPGYDLDSLLAVAVKVFNDKGYDGTSMEVLAQRLGITKSSIYHHVSGKSELLELALARALNALFAVTTEDKATAVGPSTDSSTSCGAASRCSCRASLRDVPSRVRGNTAVERRALARRREFDAFVSDLVVAAAEEGDLRPGIDPALTSRLVFGMVNSLIEWYRPRAAGSVSDLADAVVELTFDGLRRT